MKSNFHSDLSREKLLRPLLDSYYSKLKNYSFKRVDDRHQQHQGIDLILSHKTKKTSYFVDEKAQLDYINEDLPTFAFEIQYELRGKHKDGWLFDPTKKTDFYALATAIFSDEKNKYTSCKLLMVNRQKLLETLEFKGINQKRFSCITNEGIVDSGKIIMPELNPKTEGYLFWSSKNKVEKPLNLVLRLQWLIDQKIGKSLV